MIYDRDKHHRQSIRLRTYDYSQAGAYFLTLCAWNRECLFGDIIDGNICLNEQGRTVMEEWSRSTAIRREIELDEFIVMPNHIHGIILIHHVGADGVRPEFNARHIAGANGRSPLQIRNEPIVCMKPKSLSSFMAGFKSVVTKRINEQRLSPGSPVWQRNYYEHIIRNPEEMQRIREYIQNNPMKWEMDENNPDRIES